MKISNYVAYMAAQIPFLINTINMFHYFLVYNDLQYKVALMDLDPWTKSNKYITYEPGKRKNYEELTNNEDLNINVLCDKNNITVTFVTFILLINITQSFLNIGNIFEFDPSYSSTYTDSRTISAQSSYIIDDTNNIIIFKKTNNPCN
jgi:hypothetical protein